MKKSNQLNIKKTALITGASSGIGFELSKLFAWDGHNLVLVARNKQKLYKMANEFKENFGVLTRVILKDLSLPTSSEEIFTELQRESIQIDILVNNAGFNVYGPFSETNLKKELEMIQVHLVSLTHLTKLFLPGMLKQRYGRILNVGSTGSFVPGPLNAVYCATKAYILSFSEAIAEELERTGVTVTVLSPGSTRTEFTKRARMEDIKLFQGIVMYATRVAEIGYRALIEGRRVVIAGTNNKLQMFLTKFVPRKTVTKMVKNTMTRDKN